MLTNKELEQVLDRLQKANIVTTTGGQASAQDVNEFVDMAVDQSYPLKTIRVERGIIKSLNIDALELGDPAMVAATEATAPDSGDVVTPAIPRTTLTPVEVLLAYNVSFDFLRKNVEGQNANESLNRLFAKRFGKDSVLVSFKGDTTLDTSTRANKCKRIFNGFIKTALADGDVHDVSVSGSDYLETTFPAMLAALPKDYKDDVDVLGLYVSPDAYEAYCQQIGHRTTSYGDQVITGSTRPKFRGIEIIPVAGLADTDMILTPKMNLAIGYGQDMEVGKDVYYRRRIVEVTITASMHADYIVSDAVVLGQAA